MEPKITTPSSAPAEAALDHSGFGSKLRAIGALTLSAIPALFAVSACEPAQQADPFGGATANRLDQDRNSSRGSKSIESVKITNEIAVSDGGRVAPNSSGYYGHGYIIGSPINSGDTGFWFPTYELHINQGYFPDDLSYIGSDVHLSIDQRDQDAFENFRNVEQESHQQFVFEYIRKNPLNPEIEDSHLFLQNVYPLGDFVQNLDVQTLPSGIKADMPWIGSSGTKTKVGRIVDIERYGQLGDFCILELNMSGLSNGTGGGEKLVHLTIVDEDIAAWCEKAIALGRDVEVDVAQDAWEVWEPSDMIVTGIKFKDTDTKDMVLKSAGVTEQQYERIREQLSKDPVFIEAMRKQLSESGSGR